MEGEGGQPGRQGEAKVQLSWIGTTKAACSSSRRGGPQSARLPRLALHHMPPCSRRILASPACARTRHSRPASQPPTHLPSPVILAFSHTCCVPLQVSHIETEKLVVKQVEAELTRRMVRGQYSGKFAAITHFFG